MPDYLSATKRRLFAIVGRVLKLLAPYPDRDALIADYPYLQPEDLSQTLRFAAVAADDESLSIDRVA